MTISVAFSCKLRGICPSCGTRRMAQTTAYLVDQVLKRIMRLLTLLGYLIEEDGITYMARTDNIDPDDVLMLLQAASSTYRIALGPRAGRKVLSLQHAPRRVAPVTQQLCADAHGFSLHAGVLCDADQRSELEQLCRYVTRPATANEWLSVNRAGQVVLKLKTPYRNGATHIVMSPIEFMQRLVALVPRPRVRLIRFHGVLAPNAKLRSAVVPAPVQSTTAGEGDCTHAHAYSAPVRMRWARLLKRVYDIDIEQYQGCGGKLKIIAVIDEPSVIECILTHLGLCAQPPPHAPARRVDLFQAA